MDASQGDDGVQLDASQLAEYKQLKAQADDKTSRLLQEKTALEAQLKVGLWHGVCRDGVVAGWFTGLAGPSCPLCRGWGMARHAARHAMVQAVSPIPGSGGLCW